MTYLPDCFHSFHRFHGCGLKFAYIEHDFARSCMTAVTSVPKKPLFCWL